MHETREYEGNPGLCGCTSTCLKQSESLAMQDGLGKASVSRTLPTQVHMHMATMDAQEMGEKCSPQNAAYRAFSVA